jgi:hypothetical protein
MSDLPGTGQPRPSRDVPPELIPTGVFEPLKPLKSKRRRKPAQVFFNVIGWLSVAAFAVQGIRTCSRLYLTDSYVQTQGTVLVSETREGLKHDSLKFVVGFEVQSRRYRVGGSDFETPDGLSRYEVLKRYPVGSRVVVYYDPANPRHAVLSRQLPNHFWFLIGLSIAAVVLVVFVVRLCQIVAAKLRLRRRDSKAGAKP